MGIRPGEPPTSNRIGGGVPHNVWARRRVLPKIYNRLFTSESLALSGWYEGILIVLICYMDSVVTGEVHSGVQGGKQSAPKCGNPVDYAANSELPAVGSVDVDPV